MPTLTALRARADLDVISRAGLTLDEFTDEACAALRRVVPCVSVCVGTHDPATLMMTSGRKFGDLTTTDPQEVLFCTLEYAHAEASSFRELARSESRAIGMQAWLDVTRMRSARTDRLVRSLFGYGDEARVVFRDPQGMWGGMALYRDPTDPAFSDDEIDFLAGLSELFARGVRSGILARVARQPAAAPSGPAVVIVNAADEVVQLSLGAQERLAQLNSRAGNLQPLAMVLTVAVAARAVLADPARPLPVMRVRATTGQWLVLHGSPLTGVGGSGGDVVVTIEEARPPEIVGLVVAAFGLTPREREVTSMVLQGVDTKEIATTLHLSAYTVQDHLKSIFEKAGVRSRRELISRVYFDQYLPRLGGPVGPSGWFAG